MTSPRISYVNHPAPVTLIVAPRPSSLIAYEAIKFVGYDMARPNREVDCVGVNEAQAQYDAARQLGVPAWRIRVRRALPPADSLSGRGIA